jgi:hypothetical protein
MLMLGSHARQERPLVGAAYAITIDVAGQDEAATQEISGLVNLGRDSTVLTIFNLDTTGVSDPLGGKPTYRVVNRLAWQGVKHSTLYGTIISLVDTWSPMKVIIDATGVGAGLANFLLDRLGSRLMPFEFTQRSKSDLGWDFITCIETGRFKEASPMDEEMARQLEHCQYCILDGPGKTMRWGVPESTRDVLTGELVHDDYILSAAMISLLDHESWGVGESRVVRQKDVLEGLGF